MNGSPKNWPYSWDGRTDNIARVPYSWDRREKWTKEPYLQFPIEEYGERVRRIRAEMSKRELQCMLIHGSPNYLDGNVRYVSGFDSLWGNTMVLLPTEGDLVLITDSVFHGEPMHTRVFETWIKDVRASRFASLALGLSPNIVQQTVHVLKELSLLTSRIGIVSKSFFPASVLDELRRLAPSALFVFADDIMFRVKSIKSRLEIETYREAARITDAGMEAALDAIGPGVTELEVASKAIGKMIEEGAQDIWGIGPISCVAGPYSGFKHVPPTKRKMLLGDMVSIDLGCNFNGYQTDVHRCTTVGKPNAQQEKLLETTLRVEEAVIDAVKPGTIIRELVQMQERMLTEAGYGDYIYDILGHGMGTDLWNLPMLIPGYPGQEGALQPNMIFNVEPMVVIEGFGTGCFEDAVLVTDTGHEELNRCRKRVW